MRILIIANDHLTIKNFRMELLQRLINEKLAVVVAVPQNDNNSLFEQIGCQVRTIRMKRRGTNPIDDFHTICDINAAVKSFNPDVVLTFTIKANVYGGMVCRLHGIPYIANITGLGSAVANEGIMQKISTKLYAIGLKKANMVFFQNADNQRFMTEKGVVKGQNKLIPGSGVNLEKYSFSEYPQVEEINFLYMARLMKEKGIELYLEAARYYHLHSRNVRFHICGDCEPEYQDTVNELHEKQVVVYHGPVKEPIKFYQMANCVILPTYYPEGMNNVLLESLACGRPIISTDIPGTHDIIEDGVNGLVIKQKDANDLIVKIDEFLNMNYQKRRELGYNGRKKVEQYFDRNIVVNNYIEEIMKVAKERRIEGN